MSNTQPVLVGREPPIGVITLNRPESLNAVNEDLYHAFEDAWAQLNSDPAVRAIILTGAGGKAFSAGHDTKEVLKADEYGLKPETMGGMKKILDPFTLKPLVGAVSGWCVGHGMDWAGHCDLLVASEDSRFSLPESRIGVSAGYVWDNVPHVAAMGDGLKLLLDAKPISAAEAHRIGLVYKVVPKAEVMTEARKLALELSWLTVEQSTKIKRVAYFWRNLMLEECGHLGKLLTDQARAEWNQRQHGMAGSKHG